MAPVSLLSDPFFKCFLRIYPTRQKYLFKYSKLLSSCVCTCSIAIGKLNSFSELIRGIDDRQRLFFVYYRAASNGRFDVRNFVPHAMNFKQSLMTRLVREEEYTLRENTAVLRVPIH